MTQEESLVRELLAYRLRVPADSFGSDQRLARDLRLNGDDYGMWLVPELQKRLGIRPPLAEWNAASTVGELIALIERHVADQPKVV